MCKTSKIALGPMLGFTEDICTPAGLSTPSVGCCGCRLMIAAIDLSKMSPRDALVCGPTSGSLSDRCSGSVDERYFVWCSDVQCGIDRLSYSPQADLMLLALTHADRHYQIQMHSIPSVKPGLQMRCSARPMWLQRLASGLEISGWKARPSGSVQLTRPARRPSLRRSCHC